MLFLQASKATRGRAWQAGPSLSCQCNRGHAQATSGRGQGFAGLARNAKRVDCCGTATKTRRFVPQRQASALLRADQVPFSQDGSSDQNCGQCQCGKGKAQGGAHFSVPPLGTIAQRLATGTKAFCGTFLQWARSASPVKGTSTHPRCF
eukprot:4781880-Amphidinium_carterae.1